MKSKSLEGGEGTGGDMVSTGSDCDSSSEIGDCRVESAIIESEVRLDRTENLLLDIWDISFTRDLVKNPLSVVEPLPS